MDPEGCDERHQAAAARRELAIKALPDAMATLKAFLPADGAVKIFQLTDLLATATAGSHGDNRGIGARRIDALVDIADQLLTLGHLDLSYYLGNPLPDHGSPRTRAAADDSHIDCGDSDPLSTNNDSTKPADAEHDNEDAGDTATEPSKSRSALRSRPASPAATAAPSSSRKLCGACGSTGAAQRSLTRQGRRPHLSVTLGLGTLAGLDNLPGKLAGFGAIPPGLARSIAKSAATITALLTDPETGSITDAGALVYRPRQALRDQIAALLGTCQFPSCRQPVWRCDIDHREPFDHHNPEQGGHTTRENTGPYCRRHHLFKHHTEWQTRPDPSCSVLTWISPTGHRYVKGRIQATPPDIWVATVGTDIAERLDNIRATVDVLGETKMAGSVPEELLTAMLLRHELNRPSYEYDPVVGNGLHNDSAVNNNTDTDTDNKRPQSTTTAPTTTAPTTTAPTTTAPGVLETPPSPSPTRPMALPRTRSHGRPSMTRRRSDRRLAENTGPPWDPGTQAPGQTTQPQRPGTQAPRRPAPRHPGKQLHQPPRVDHRQLRNGPREIG